MTLNDVTTWWIITADSKICIWQIYLARSKYSNYIFSLWFWLHTDDILRLIIIIFTHSHTLKLAQVPGQIIISRNIFFNN